MKRMRQRANVPHSFAFASRGIPTPFSPMAAMRILILGGTGFIGAPLTRQLNQDGYAVAVLHRGKTVADLPTGVTTITGNRNRLDATIGAIDAFAPEVAIDVIPYTEAQARHTAEVLSGHTRRIVALSSGDVYRNYDGLRGASAHPPDTAPLAEDAPLRDTRYPYRNAAPSADHWMHDYDKILVENVYRDASNLAHTILRLPAVYGPGDTQHRLFAPLKRMDDDRPAILVGRKQARWTWSRDYVENVAAAIARAATDARAANQTYNIGERDPVTEGRWLRRIARAAGWDGRVLPVPDEELPAHLQSEFDFAYDLALDTSRFHTELDFTPPVSLDIALERTVKWTRDHPPDDVDPEAFDYAAEDAVLAPHRG